MPLVRVILLHPIDLEALVIDVGAALLDLVKLLIDLVSPPRFG